MTGAQALANAVKCLKAANVPDGANDARILLAYALEIGRSRLTPVLPDEMSKPAIARFDAAIAARCIRQPVAQITGRREFYGRSFLITPDVLDPRPETELLVETALGAPFETVLDLGTGSGCILLSLLAENTMATGQGVDISKAALEVARQNAENLGLAACSSFTESNWFDAVSKRFDLIVANPPYIAADEMATLAPEVRDWEPALALTPGGDGLAAYRTITTNAPRFLNPNGRLIVEIGATQAVAVSALFRESGLRDITTTKDLDGRDRLISGMVS